jgi:hypothetical protein
MGDHLMNLFETNLPVLQTMSDVDLRAQPEYSMSVCIDWRKIGLYHKDEWPTPWPAPKFLGNDCEGDKLWFESAMQAEYVVFDVETVQISENPDRWSKEIFQVGLYPKGGTPVIWDKTTHPDFEGAFVDMYKDLVACTPMVAHNAQFDVGRIRYNFGVEVWDYVEIHDTICMHHILWAEFPHNLEFIASMHSEHPKAKHLGVGDHDYLVGDVVATAEAYEAFMGYFRTDPASYRLYRETLQRLLPITVCTMQHGFPVNPEFVEQSLEWIPQHILFAEELAHTYTGFEISLNSAPQLRAYFDGVEDVYELAKKAGGATIRRKLTEKGELSFDKDTVNELRKAFVAMDHNEDLTPELVTQRLELGAHPLLEAKALHGKARVYLANYVKPLLIPLIKGDDIGINERGEWYTDSPLHVGEGSPEE